MLSLNRVGVLVLLSLPVGGGLLAQQPNGPIPNWTVPPYRGTSASGGLSTMADISPGIAFVAMQPCRVFDTRNANGPYGGPRLLGNVTRNFDIDSGPCTGIPSAVEAYSMNFGAILPDGANSFVTIWPTGSAQPLVSSINPIQGGVVANAAIVPAGTGGSISVFPNTGLHLYGDINGYFTDTFNTGNQVLILGNIGNQSVLHVDNASSADGSRAILGNTSATTGFTWGVLGHSNSSGGGSAGVRGAALAPSGRTYGVFGETLSLSAGSAGVLGLDGGGLAAGHTLYTAAGVRGESRGLVGVFGVTEQFIAVRGVLVNPATGDSLAEGHLGSSGAMDYGVFSQGPYGGTGAKYFVEPHPEKADMVIRYVSLEGNESGTYFRGRGKFQNGLATIEVPEDFRLVTDRENLSIQVTPIGEMASVAVRSIGLDRIVVRGSRNVEFFYTVNGVRKTHKHLTPIGPGREYMPETADAKMPLYLTEGQKEMLISNGTYTENGTVNMETARRLGWDKEWEKRGRPAPQPSD